MFLLIPIFSVLSVFFFLVYWKGLKSSTSVLFKKNKVSTPRNVEGRHEKKKHARVSV